MSEMVPCPHCDGKGGSTGLGCGPNGCGIMTLPCLPCGSEGKVTRERAAQIESWRPLAQKIRAQRNERGLSLREEAKRRGISVVDLSQMERAVIEPVGAE